MYERGGSEGGVWLGPPPPPRVPLWAPAEGAAKDLKRKSAWHRRRRSKMLAVGLKHWKGEREGGAPAPPPAAHSSSNASLWGGGGAVSTRQDRGFGPRTLRRVPPSEQPRRAL